MRNFTTADYAVLQEELKVLTKEINIFKDYTIDGITTRTILKPIVTIATPKTDECLNYSKQIWNFLLLDWFTVKYAEVLNSEVIKDDSFKNYKAEIQNNFGVNQEKLNGEIMITIEEEEAK